MPLVSDIPLEAMRRMRLIAETNQLIQEKIAEDAQKKVLEDDSSDEFESAEEASCNGDDAPAIYPSESFVEFLDNAIDFMTPTSKRRSELTARNAYLMHNATISEHAYDDAVEKVRSMHPLHDAHVTFAEDVEELAIDVCEAERVKTGEEMADEEVEKMLNGSQGSDAYWWRKVLYNSANYIATPCEQPSSNLVTPVAPTMSASSFFGLCTPKTPKTPKWQI